MCLSYVALGVKFGLLYAKQAFNQLSCMPSLLVGSLLSLTLALLQVASLLLADRVWKKIQSQWPQILGKENPFNSQIEEVFGDQGGH